MSAPTPAPQEITQVLVDLQAGNRAALDKLLGLIYDPLRRLAQNQLNRERADHTLNATALVHEAYLKLIDQKKVDWRNRAHFLAVAAQAMRRILIDYARGKLAEKRGGGAAMVTFNEEALRGDVKGDDLIALDDALKELNAAEPRAARVVELQFFGGLTQPEIAEVLGVSEITVRRDWRFARAWIAQQLKTDE